MKLSFQYVFIIVLLSACNTSNNKIEKKEWWKESVFYEIYMPSYQDSDGNGYSDFRGMTERLDYIHDLGIKGVWLTPFLQSPKVDNGYDISNYYQIDSIYGSMDEFKIFVQEAHKRGIKIIMDMVVNHSSTECHWFKESRKSKDNPYRDYYIWQDEPNNWESFFGGTAWEYDSLSGQYYYHKFDVQMADLNWQNPKVQEEFQNILRYWLELGIDGFRLDVINFLTTNGITQENPDDENGNQKHLYDINQDGVKQAMELIKKTIDKYEDRFIVGEIGSDKINILKQYQGEEMLDVVFNFNFGSIPEFSAQKIYNELVSMEENMSNYPTLFFGSHDMPRLISRLAQGDQKRAIALAALTILGRSVPFIYYGEEIGMKNHLASTVDEIIDIQGITQYKLAIEQGKNPEEALVEGNKHNRDKSRSPMQWNSDTLAGFSNTKSWIMPNPDYKEINVARQQNESESMLNAYKSLIALRNSEAVLQYGAYQKLEFQNDCIHMSRVFQDEQIEIYINFGEARIIDIPEKAKLLMGSAELKTNGFVVYK